MKYALLTAATIACLVAPAEGASLSKSYSYFSIRGKTLEDIENQFSQRGPHVSKSGLRHPGATRMQFTTNLTYAQGKDFCQIVDARTTLNAKVILPRWQRPRKVEADVRLIWDTLSADIKRHEESHVVIAKNYAAELEKSLKAMGRQKNCQVAAAKAKEITARVLAQHDRAQADFDRVEGKNFESRILRLLKYRLEQIKDGRIPG